MKVSAKESADRLSVPPPGDGPGGDAGWDAERFRSLLVEFGRRVSERGLIVRMFVVGEVAMSLVYDRTRVTRDIDAVFEPKTQANVAERDMAADHGLPNDWLTGGAKRLMPSLGPDAQVDVFAADGISVNAAPADYLFAIKAASALAEADGVDLRRLFGLLDTRSVDEVFAIVERFYDPAKLSPESHLFIESEFERYRSTKDSR